MNMMLAGLMTTLQNALPRTLLETPPGTRPGTITVHENALPPSIRVISYGPQELDDQDNVDVERLSELVGKHSVTWVNVTGLGDAKVIKMSEVYSICIA